jgi:hypothetical protein
MLEGHLKNDGALHMISQDADVPGDQETPLKRAEVTVVARRHNHAETIDFGVTLKRGERRDCVRMSMVNIHGESKY